MDLAQEELGVEVTAEFTGGLLRPELMSSVTFRVILPQVRQAALVAARPTLMELEVVEAEAELCFRESATLSGGMYLHSWISAGLPATRTKRLAFFVVVPSDSILIKFVVISYRWGYPVVRGRRKNEKNGRALC